MIGHCFDIYTSSHYTDRGKGVFDKPEIADHEQSFFHACNGRAFCKMDNMDFIIYYPIGLLPEELATEEFLKRYETIMGHLGGLAKYEGIHNAKKLDSNVNNCMDAHSVNSMNVETWPIIRNKLVTDGLAQRKAEGFVFTTNCTASKVALLHSGNKSKLEMDLDTMGSFITFDDPRFVVWRISLDDSLGNVHTYYSALLVRALFSAVYRQAILNMIKVKEAHSKFKWFTCLQIANYSRDLPFKDFQKSPGDDHGFYYYYWTHDNRQCGAFTMITKEQLFLLFKGEHIELKNKEGRSLTVAPGNGMNYCFSSANLLLPGTSYYELAELFTKGEYLKIYGIIRQK
jgi:hypothetical protein